MPSTRVLGPEQEERGNDMRREETIRDRIKEARWERDKALREWEDDSALKVEIRVLEWVLEPEQE